MKNELTAKRLIKALDDNRMTAAELSLKAHVSEASISQYVNGSHKPSNLSSGKMADVLKVNPLWLMGFDVPMKPESTLPEVPTYVDGTMELIQLFGKATPEQREATLNLLRSFMR